MMITIKRILFVCLLSFSFLLVACSQSVELINNIPEDQANDIITVLLTQGIKANKTPGTDGRINVVIDLKDMPNALLTLQNNGYPKPHYAQFNEIFTGDSFTSSPIEQRARYNYLLAQSIEDTLGAIEGVVLARVHVVLPQKATFLDPSSPASAGVLLKYNPNIQLDWMVPDIKKLVADSIPGLVPENVSVLLVPAQRLTIQGISTTSISTASTASGAANTSSTLGNNSGNNNTNNAQKTLERNSIIEYGVIGGVILVLFIGIGVMLFIIMRKRRKESNNKPSAPSVPNE